jgi:glycosyltransferase involved in cell wall biosynthesis
MNISVIVPVFNEENYILPLLEQLDTVLWPTFVKSVEIIVVNDCSSDLSAEKIADFNPLNLVVKVIHNQQNRGKGYSVKKGIEQALGDVFVFQDADLELLPADIPSLLEAMYRLNIEFINGSRYMPGLVRPLHSYRRYLGNRIFSILASFFINLKITDLACGFKIIHRNLYEKLKLNEDGFGFEAELLIKAMQVKRNNIAEVPVHYFPRNAGEGKKIRNIDGLKVFFKIIRYALFRFS